MSGYLVTLIGEAREVYYVEADSPEDAAANWHRGHLQVSEASGMEVESVDDDGYLIRAVSGMPTEEGDKR